MIRNISLDNDNKTFRYKLKPNSTIHGMCVYNSIDNPQVTHNYPLIKLTTQIITEENSYLTYRQIIPYSNKIELIDYPLKHRGVIKLIFSIDIQNASQYRGKVNVIIKYD